MKKTYSTLFILCMIYSVLVLVGVLLGNLSFGYGLGDIYLLVGVLIIIVIILLGRFFYKKISERKKSSYSIFFSVLIMFFMVYSFLRLTIYRGSENPWNGNVLINNSSPEQGEVPLEKFEDLE
ncbi:MAG: hypothetical protein R2769_00260 [Saprospiraceae bacterium]